MVVHLNSESFLKWFSGREPAKKTPDAFPQNPSALKYLNSKVSGSNHHSESSP